MQKFHITCIVHTHACGTIVPRPCLCSTWATNSSLRCCATKPSQLTVRNWSPRPSRFEVRAHEDRMSLRSCALIHPTHFTSLCLLRTSLARDLLAAAAAACCARAAICLLRAHTAASLRYRVFRLDATRSGAGIINAMMRNPSTIMTDAAVTVVVINYLQT